MTKKYTLIYADPPWAYRDKAADGNRGAGFKYPVMSVLDICRLPVWDLADENCLLAMWWVPTQPLEALKVVEAWGFRLMTMKGFTWIKCGSRQPDKLVMGMGHMTRANSEDCLFAVKGKLPTRINAGIVQSFTAPRLEHSRKPDIVREKLVQLLGDVSRIELFARQTSHGFDVWGNQCEDPAVQLHPGYALDIAGLTNVFSNAPLSPTDNQGRERAA
ncbi:MT-A70 family methyltransferase [Escherichia coli]|uniref:MT-A70 family methyltransferase n=1 Tax=Escherichia coli TaxID=562 RepID=UPI0009457F7F|nr:MT-A70 family methyltransferase [Escherichia coli]MBA1779859.1 adenine methylase [Escherichia coli]MDN2082378.1 adenine methylase [Escherichia coli]MDN2109755.1 adenine methylase [Escherichia coli]HAN7920289.1 adenine methylase [Escherichia coli]HAN8564881.1 adenine methylase [Escherichia coli]